MENINKVISVPAQVSGHTRAVAEVYEAFDAWVGHEGKTSTIINKTAAAMIAAFDVRDEDTGARITAWYELKGKAKAEVNEARARFVEKFTAAGKTTSWIDQNWKRIKEASGYATAGNRASGGNDPETLNLQNLKTIINRIFTMEENGHESAWSEHKGALMEIFEDMGGEVDNLG